MVEERKHDIDGGGSEQPIPQKIWQAHPKLTIVLNFINKDTAVNQLMIKAFEEVYRRNSQRLRIIIQQTRLQEAAHDPVVCVIDSQTKVILSQTFNFIDVLGGKQLINAENLERFFAIRGVFEPKGSDIELISHGRREAEIHNYVTQVAQCAGPEFAFDVGRLAQLNTIVEEMDKLEVIEVDAANFSYQNELVDVCRNIIDPFANQLTEVAYEPNPNDMTKLTKQIGYANELPDGPIGA